jgi:hypothetical protein
MYVSTLSSKKKKNSYLLKSYNISNDKNTRDKYDNMIAMMMMMVTSLFTTLGRSKAFSMDSEL